MEPVAAWQVRCPRRIHTRREVRGSLWIGAVNWDASRKCRFRVLCSYLYPVTPRLRINHEEIGWLGIPIDAWLHRHCRLPPACGLPCGVARIGARHKTLAKPPKQVEHGA